MLLIIDDCTCFLVCLEFTYCVTTLGNCTALGFVPLKVGKGAGLFFAVLLVSVSDGLGWKLHCLETFFESLTLASRWCFQHLTFATDVICVGFRNLAMQCGPMW